MNQIVTAVVETATRSIREVRFVYFVEAEGLDLIKIGVSNQSRRRMMAMQTDSPVPLTLVGVIACPDSGMLEGRLHIEFAHLRVRGEWFRAAPELRDHIKVFTSPDDASAMDALRRYQDLERRVKRSELRRRGDIEGAKALNLPR